MNSILPFDWRDILAGELSSEYFAKLVQFVDDERRSHVVFPSDEDLFSAFRFCSYSECRVVILGQDPYHEKGQAHGLAFSVPDGAPQPPSLANIFRELQADLSIPRPSSGCLVGWAKQGVLLLNTVLTVREGEANSHKGRGWERFTDAVIGRISDKQSAVVFVLWGAGARSTKKLIAPRHIVIESAHPSPLSAYRGFFGSRPFSRVNKALVDAGQSPIEWGRVDSLDAEQAANRLY
jgi:uracil-DNA glycosylase